VKDHRGRCYGGAIAKSIYFYCYTFRIGHGAGIMDDHSMTLSCGDSIRSINYKPVLSPHQ
jgi:hypothetical protein